MRFKNDQEMLRLVADAMARKQHHGRSGMAFMHVHPGWNPLEEKGHALILLETFKLNVSPRGKFYYVSAPKAPVGIGPVKDEDLSRAICKVVAEIERHRQDHELTRTMQRFTRE